jgi:Regulator of Chromosome Condensation (RCC1) repeat protein
VISFTIMIRSAGFRSAVIATVVVISTTCDNPSGPPPVTSVQVTPETWAATALGDTVRFTAVARNAIGRRVFDHPITWRSDPPGVVFVREDGSAFSAGSGLARVIATIDAAADTAQVSVVQTIESVAILIGLYGHLSALGDSIQLPVAAYDHNSYGVAGTTFSFQSLNENVATVSPTGWVTAVSPGVANLVATAAGKADTAPVQVLQDVATVTLSPDSAVLEDGTSRQFTAILKDRNGYLVTDRAPDSWSSSDTLVLGVGASGLASARAVKLGPANVIATSGGVRGAAPAYVFTPFVSVAAGPAKTCAVSSRGRPYCWGWIDYTTGLRSTVPFERTASPALGASIGAGVTLACGLTPGATAFCWGDAPFGLAGAPVASPPTFSSLSVGYVTAYGLTASGDAYAWTPVSPTPALVPGSLSFATISATYLACGTVASGAAYCWGANLTGGIGDSTFTDRAVPTAVVGGHTFAAVVAGGGHTCGITTGGPTYCWGRNTYGAFGDSTTTNTTYPVPAAAGLALTSIALGDFHTCGLIASGAAYCWGLGERGSIGNGTFDPARLTPAPVSGGLTFASISAASQHTCGLTSSGALFCWGRNEDGELGDGTGANRAVPTRVAGSRP